MVLEAGIGFSEMSMLDMRRSDISIAGKLISVTSTLEAIAWIINSCALIRFYLEQAQIQGVKDIDDWAGY